jgi:hypothetical protein
LGLPLAPALLNATSLSTVPWAIYVWWSSVVLAALLLGWLAFLIMLLKSFIWNIYQAVLIVIVTGDMISDLEKKASASVDPRAE